MGGGGGGGGGAGSDEISPDLGNQVIGLAPSASAGSVTFTYTPGSTGLTACAARGATRHPRNRVIGSTRPDGLRGTRGADVIVGGPGRDRIRGRDGADLVCGGRGPDRLTGGRGDDRLLGGAHNDVLDGGVGRDLLVGGTGRDRLLSEAGVGIASSPVTDGATRSTAALGRDVARVDVVDRTRRCETVIRG